MEEFDVIRFKKDINNFLFERLPQDTTLAQLENIACGMLGIVEVFYLTTKKKKDSGTPL